jgi:hypothetical protein
MAQHPEAQSAALQEVTHQAFEGVLAALERRNIPLREFPGPILIGIIAWPELKQGGGLFQEARVGQEGSLRGGG